MQAHVDESAVARRGQSGDRVTSGSPRVVFRRPAQTRGATLFQGVYTTRGQHALLAWEKFSRKADYSRSAVYTECDDHATPTRETSVFPRYSKNARELRQFIIHDRLGLREMAGIERGLVTCRADQEGQLERLRRSFTRTAA